MVAITPSSKHHRKSPGVVEDESALDCPAVDPQSTTATTPTGVEIIAFSDAEAFESYELVDIGFWYGWISGQRRSCNEPGSTDR